MIAQSLCFLILINSQIQAPTNTNILLDTAADCLRFVTEFFEVISKSAPHIYHSALQLVPKSSIVWKLYGQQIYSLARVVTGVPTSWDSCTAIVGTTDIILGATWSPCGQFIVTTSSDTIQVWDSNTLEKVSVFKPSGNLMGAYPLFSTFSPDGSLLACSFYP